MAAFQGKILALSGGVGGAKLARGLAECLAPEQLSIVANTADDFEYWDLKICPDIDSILYALADLNDETRGWGLSDESWRTMDAMRRLTGSEWFQLGDQDLATHLFRSMALRRGESLTAVTATLAGRLGVSCTLLPMTEDTVATRVSCEQGELAFQEYFVRERCEPKVHSIAFDGIEQARLNPAVVEALSDPHLAGIVICPSNPFLSIDPILSLSGCRDAIRAASVPVVGVSPIISGRAVKGPAAKLMDELSMPATATAVADYYGDLLDGFIIDQQDHEQCAQIANERRLCRSAQSVMGDLASKRDLAGEVLRLVQELR